ncbi:ABC-2 family transporter protein [Deinococcus malanensis]|uniref:ABC-2 family transporter protein n=1 Tax=Deinococcus malanensis TaxID=1706855 RepID=UPI003630A31B
MGLSALGFTARFLWEYTIGLLAFWTESNTSFQELVWLIYAALGGMFAPLSFYPSGYRTSPAGPLSLHAGLPAQLLAGKATPEQAWQGAGVLLVWLVVFWFLRAAVWRAGLRKYGAVGA